MFDWPELRADGPIFGSHCLVEEQLLQIKFDWPELRADGPPCDAEGDNIRLLQ